MPAKMKTLAPVTVTTAETAEQITALDIPSTGLIVQANTVNAGLIYVGDSTVTSSNGMELEAGETFSITAEEIGSSNDEIVLSDVWIDAQLDGDGVRIQYFGRH